MSDSGHNYGKKGVWFGRIAILFALFIILLIWVYQKNFKLTFDFIQPYLG
ncbi:hypothetical protein [Portibacter marinus]|nr:hypothetical protein [Portibacter marinus]